MTDNPEEMVNLNKVVVSFRNLSKHYTVKNGESRDDTLKALQNVSFDVKKGEILGIVGRNGAGKSTLLNILSKVTIPTSGKVVIDGTITSILGIGTGFHPELTGRENIFMNAAILGFDRSTVLSKIQEIIDFSGLSEFIESPVKTYSSGMYLRLAFSIFVKLPSDILLLDEVLSVGDSEFKKKCTKVISDMAASGTTIILVSHNISEVLRLCTRCIYLENGEVVMQGPPKSTSEHYLEAGMVETEEELRVREVSQNPKPQDVKGAVFTRSWDVGKAPRGDGFVLKRITVKSTTSEENLSILRSEEIEIKIAFEKRDNESEIQLGIHLTNLADIWVLCSSHTFEKGFETIARYSGEYVATAIIPANLLNSGVYSIGLTVSKNDFEIIGQWERMLKFRVENEEWEKNQIWATNQAVIRPNLSWNVESTMSK